MSQASIDQALQAAVGQYHGGQWADAEQSYRRILAAAPDHVVALHHLGILLARQRRLDEGIRLLARVVELMPHNAQALSDLGNALRDHGRTHDAAGVLERAVALDPKLALAHNNLGSTYRELGRTDDAAREFQIAVELAPTYAEAHCNLGNTLCDRGKFDEAAAAFGRAIALQPRLPAAHNNLGVTLQRLKRPREAIAAFQRAIELHGEYAEAYSNLGQSLELLDRVDEAIASYQRALQLNPNFAAAYSNLGNALRARKRPHEALAALRRAVDLQPIFPSAHSNIGNALCDLGDLEGAVNAYRYTLRLQSDHVDALSNLASTLIDLGRLDEPRSLLYRAIEIDPTFADAHWNLAIFLLLQGEFAKGFSEYEWRWKVKNLMGDTPRLPEPRWDGSPLGEKTILLYTEQGAGDAIQFARYVPLVAERGGKVILRCPPGLRRLFAQVGGVEKVIDTSEAIPAYDRHCPLLSLPLVFGTTLETIPAPVGYLNADGALAEAWRQKISRDGNRRVGLVWAGAAIHRNDRNRSTMLSSFSPLAGVKETTFFSLQKGSAGKQPAPEGLKIVDFTDELHDFADTAALLENLDLLITVDTSVAHLAGAMGKPVWVILPSNPDWRWMYNRSDSPWYPTMRLFRQSKPNDWPAVIGQIADALRQWRDA